MQYRSVAILLGWGFLPSFFSCVEMGLVAKITQGRYFFRVRALRLSHLAIDCCSYLALFNEAYKVGRQTEQDHLHHIHARQLLDLTLINSVSVDQYINGFTVDMLKVRLSGSTKTLINAVPKTFSVVSCTSRFVF